jgi:hypothetical protein
MAENKPPAKHPTSLPLTFPTHRYLSMVWRTKTLTFLNKVKVENLFADVGENDPFNRLEADGVLPLELVDNDPSASSQSYKGVKPRPMLRLR